MVPSSEPWMLSFRSFPNSSHPILLLVVCLQVVQLVDYDFNYYFILWLLLEILDENNKHLNMNNPVDNVNVPFKLTLWVSKSSIMFCYIFDVCMFYWKNAIEIMFRPWWDHFYCFWSRITIRNLTHLRMMSRGLSMDGHAYTTITQVKRGLAKDRSWLICLKKVPLD